MRAIYQIAVLILFIAATDSSIYNDVKDTLSKYVDKSIKTLKGAFNKEGDVHKPGTRYKVKHRTFLPTNVKVRHMKQPKERKELFRHQNKPEKKLGLVYPSKRIFNSDKKKNANAYQLDPVLNNIRRQNNGNRRKYSSSSTSDSQSSSLELRDWKNEWKEYWIKKKIEALNKTIPQGDVVNMVAARPWGVPCGDPNQHDMPWGTCVMAAECEPEYRIYRGDFQCGRTNFVCCSIQLTNYDMYQGFDASFDESGLTTDSEEMRNKGKNSRERKKKRRERERRRRRRARMKRKKKIKKNIRRIIKEMKKILSRQYRNGTSQRKKKTKQLKNFIKELKKKYKQDRKSVKNIHEIELVKIDSALLNRLKEIKKMNQDFVTNATFREIITKGMINRVGARMLVEAYPDLVSYFTDNTRRSGKHQVVPEKIDDLDYDVEYGMLYY